VVYAIVTDLTRSAEWSVECIGGQWISGTPGAVGSVFRGNNVRAEDVVAWAPVVRGTWSTESEVVAAEPERLFSWAMRTKAGQRQDSVWSYLLEPTDDGCLLVHHFRMGKATEASSASPRTWTRRRSGDSSPNGPPSWPAISRPPGPNQGCHRERVTLPLICRSG